MIVWLLCSHILQLGTFSPYQCFFNPKKSSTSIGQVKLRFYRLGCDTSQLILKTVAAKLRRFCGYFTCKINCVELKLWMPNIRGTVVTWMLADFVSGSYTNLEWNIFVDWKKRQKRSYWVNLKYKVDSIRARCSENHTIYMWIMHTPRHTPQ